MEHVSSNTTTADVSKTKLIALHRHGPYFTEVRKSCSVMPSQLAAMAALILPFLNSDSVSSLFRLNSLFTSVELACVSGRSLYMKNITSSLLRSLSCCFEKV